MPPEPPSAHERRADSGGCEIITAMASAANRPPARDAEREAAPVALVLRSFPIRVWFVSAFLAFLSAFMVFQVVRGSVGQLLLGREQGRWWQYAATGLLLAVAFAVAATGEVRRRCGAAGRGLSRRWLCSPHFAAPWGTARALSGTWQVETCRFDKVRACGVVFGDGTASDAAPPAPSAPSPSWMVCSSCRR